MYARVMYCAIACTVYIYHQIWGQGALWEGGRRVGEEGDAGIGEWAEFRDGVRHTVICFGHEISPGASWVFARQDLRVLNRTLL